MQSKKKKTIILGDPIKNVYLFVAPLCMLNIYYYDDEVKLNLKFVELIVKTKSNIKRKNLFKSFLN